MVAQVKAWGNSQGVRFSKDLLDSLGISLNEYLDVNIVDGNIVLSKSFKHRTLEERTAEFQGKMGPYQEMSWTAPEGREQW